jgi:hypothetical protein
MKTRKQGGLFMKKNILAIIIAATLILVLFTACGGGTSTGNVKTGLGHVVTIGKSEDAAADKEGFVQVDTIMAAVSVDSAGKIVSVNIDYAQTKVPFAASCAVRVEFGNSTTLSSNPNSLRIFCTLSALFFKFDDIINNYLLQSIYTK